MLRLVSTPANSAGWTRERLALVGLNTMDKILSGTTFHVREIRDAVEKIVGPLPDVLPGNEVAPPTARPRPARYHLAHLHAHSLAESYTNLSAHNSRARRCHVPQETILHTYRNKARAVLFHMQPQHLAQLKRDVPEAFGRLSPLLYLLVSQLGHLNFGDMRALLTAWSLTTRQAGLDLLQMVDATRPDMAHSVLFNLHHTRSSAFSLVVER